MTWVWWVLGAVVVVWLLDRLALWAEGRGWLYWRRRRGTGGAGTALGDVFLLFQPTRAHLVAEQERQRQTIAYPESGAPPLGVDLDAGTAVVPGGTTAGGAVDGAAEGSDRPSGDVAAPFHGEDGPDGVRP